MALEKKELEIKGYERVIKFLDKETGLLAVIAIHSTKLGPAIGGTRIYPYSTFKEGLNDVLRLSKAMSYKASFLEGRSGGGKSIIFYDPKKGVPEELLKSFSEAVNSLKGTYYCAEDVGCFQKELKVIHKYTPYIVGLEVKGSSGNPSNFTALSTLRAMEAALFFCEGSSALRGKSVAIQGCGQVGFSLAQMLFYRGANLTVCDKDGALAKRVELAFGAGIVPIDAIYDVKADIFSPCALGATLNKNTIARLRCKIVVGAANNQLASEEDGVALKERGILYAPDFITNCGGLINVQTELMPSGYNPTFARDTVLKTYDKLYPIFHEAKQRDLDTNRIALEIASNKIKELSNANGPEFVLHHSTSG